MQIEIDGTTIETADNGHLLDPQQWSEKVAEHLASSEDIELSEKHWDVLKFLRSEFFDNNGNQPMERAIKKAMEQKWGEKLSSKDLYDLFPGAPSKQGVKVAGLPATTRKGGY